MVDEGYVYWGDSTAGAILRLPINAPAEQPPERVAAKPAAPVVAAIAVDADHVYWFARTAGDANTPVYEHTLYKRAKCGSGPVTALASSAQGLNGIVVAGDYVYWSESGGIARVPK